MNGVRILTLMFACFIFAVGFDWQRWAEEKCGDGICQKWEARRGSCLQDCHEQTAKIIPSPNAERESQIKSVRILTKKGGRVDWSPSGNDLIAFDRKGEDGFYDIWIINSYGSGERCLTCNRSDILPRHNGNPTWHPSGEFIVIQAEDPQLSCESKEAFAKTPGGGINNNLWVVNKEGIKFWQLTHVKDGMGVLHPHFSHDGSKLLWSEKVSNEPEAWGDWVMKIADFRIENGRPRIRSISEIKPERFQFYETDGFSPDDRKIAFSAFSYIPRPTSYNVELTSLEEYVYDLDTKELQRLTSDITEWDEFLQFTPDGKKFVWMSSHDISQERDMLGGIIGGKLKSDYWIMDTDGGNKKRLTHFNAPGYPEYRPNGACVADFSFSPDGTKIVAKVRELPSKFDQNERIMIIELKR